MRLPGRETKRVLKIILLGLLCCTLLSGCAGKERPSDTDRESEEETTAVTPETLPETEVEEEEQIFGAVPYFDEDTDGMLQYADGYLYGYLSGRIFRVDAKTGETTVLVAMRNTLSNHFCIDNGYLYYFYIPQVSFTDGIRGDLYRLDLNSADSEPPVLLAEDVLVSEDNAAVYDSTTVNMSVYQDILYIMLKDEAGCLRLFADGSVEEIALKDTLYGLLPAGYSAPWRYDLPSIPYCAAHYGYFFAQNEDNCLVCVDVASGKWESIGGKNAYSNAFLTHEGIYLADSARTQWLRCDLENMTEPISSFWREYNYSEKIVGWEEEGVYLQNGQYDPETGYTVRLVFVNREGNETPLLSFVKQVASPSPYWIEYYYIKNRWLYYRDLEEDGYWLARIALTGGEPEKLYCYDSGSRFDEMIKETEVVEKNTENAGTRRISTSIAKLWIKEEQAGDAAINTALKKIYADAEAELEEDNQWVMEEYYSEEETDWEWVEDMVYERYQAYIDYVDEDYLGICMMGDSYLGGAHGYYWYDYYVFDRHTGKRLSLQDFVSNSPEEITEIVKAYIVAGYEWTNGSQAEDALEPDRFFLTAEGLGIHYDVYEVGSYADGPFEVIIPFKVWEMKEGMQPGV
ncbi:MAG: DUF3298 domain-containing protein [Lachnospiraceae bacterium]|nr:DUF3298 domain-containing protein [Lachnospiraceae bacterium]